MKTIPLGVTPLICDGVYYAEGERAATQQFTKCDQITQNGTEEQGPSRGRQQVKPISQRARGRTETGAGIQHPSTAWKESPSGQRDGAKIELDRWAATRTVCEKSMRAATSAGLTDRRRPKNIKAGG
jgi:hypothetical protein